MKTDAPFLDTHILMLYIPPTWRIQIFSFVCFVFGVAAFVVEHHSVASLGNFADTNQRLVDGADLGRHLSGSAVFHDPYKFPLPEVGYLDPFGHS